MLLDANAKHVYAIEPSDAYDVLLKNTSKRSEKITYLKIRGDELAISLMTQVGFVDVDIYQRHGYSWTVIDTKPDSSHSID